MSEAKGQNEDLDDLIAREVIPSLQEQPPSLKREFKPWHKPRKQFVAQTTKAIGAPRMGSPCLWIDEKASCADGSRENF